MELSIGTPVGSICYRVISCNVDKSGLVLTISHSRHVGVEDASRCLDKVRSLADGLAPGFLLLVDLTYLDSMDASCAPELGANMDLCSAKGVSSVVRVIPDRDKDIGFSLISRFHLRPKVKTRTFTSLAEAIKSLLGQSLAVVSTEVTSAQPPASPAPELTGKNEFQRVASRDR
jgi:anti-anti-sigma regulatory factor